MQTKTMNTKLIKKITDTYQQLFELADKVEGNEDMEFEFSEAKLWLDIAKKDLEDGDELEARIDYNNAMSAIRELKKCK